MSARSKSDMSDLGKISRALDTFLGYNMGLELLG